MTRYPYRVFFPGYPHCDNYDFIADSPLNYYYLSEMPMDENTICSSLKKFDDFRKQMLASEADGWDQFTKLPYIKKSLGQEKALRFPLAFEDDKTIGHLNLTCGNGRLFNTVVFYPEIKIDALIVSTDRLDYQKLKSIDELESILLNKSYFQQQTIYRWSWSLVDWKIVANDVATTDNWNFPFCKNSELNKDLLEYTRRYVRETANQPIIGVLHHLCNLNID